MAFAVYTSSVLERLADRLAEKVIRFPLAPLERETVVVMSVGMGRWISQRMAERLGVWANFEYLFPTVLIERIFGIFSGGGAPLQAFNREILSWRILSLLPDCIARDGYGPLAAYLGDGENELKRRQLAVRIAGIFDQYAVHRPEMVLGWETGGSGNPDGDERWQADLWRRLSANVGFAHHAALAARFFDEIEAPAEERSRALPSRVSLFGIATLPPLYVRVLHALSSRVDVDFYVLNPSREYWGDIVSAKEQARITRRMKPGVPRADRHISPGNPLLASMGRVGRDFLFKVLLDIDESVDLNGEFPGNGAGASTLLGMIQEDILDLVDRAAETRRVVAPGDRSIGVHSCHSPMREVEVLYDYLLDLFDGNPDVEPHDVVVMTPDIETYGPLFEAVFGAPRSENLRIPYSIADRSMRSENGAAGTFFAILDLYGGRFTAAQVLDIMECDTVLLRYGLDPGDRETIRRWIDDTRIRWGIDASDRAGRPEGLPPVEENTWRHGLDRLLLGGAMRADGERLFEGILPYDALEGGDTAVLGGLVELLDRLFEAARSLSEARTPDDWVGHLLSLVDGFFEGDETADDTASLRRVIARLGEETADAGFNGLMGFPVVRSWLEDALNEERAHGAFLSGGVTFCAMLPMRSIPFRVICMVGMSDGAYPRRDVEAGFNLMKTSYRPGDRSRRNDDRYIFLEALVSARDRLFISYVGRSITDNKPMPPSVLVSELLDYIDQGYTAPEGGTLRPAIVTEHRLQAFSPAYFSGDPKLYSYARELCAAAESFGGSSREYGPFMTGEASDNMGDVIGLDELLDFYLGPARYLLRRTLGIRLDMPRETSGDTEAFTLDGLERYLLAQRLADSVINGMDPMDLYPVLRAEGRLPHGAPGEYAFRSLLAGVRTFARAVGAACKGTRLPPLDIRLDIAGCTVTGRVDQVYPGGIVRHRYAGVRAGDRLCAWIEYCAAACAVGSGPRPVAHLIGREKDVTIMYHMNDVEPCASHLTALVEIFRAGRASLIPLFPESSLAFAREYARNRSVEDALQKARSAYQGNSYTRGDLDDPYVDRCFRKMDPFGTRSMREEFMRLARAVYDPVLKYQEER